MWREKRCFTPTWTELYSAMTKKWCTPPLTHCDAECCARSVDDLESGTRLTGMHVPSRGTTQLSTLPSPTSSVCCSFQFIYFCNPKSIPRHIHLLRFIPILSLSLTNTNVLHVLDSDDFRQGQTTLGRNRSATHLSALVLVSFSCTTTRTCVMAGRHACRNPPVRWRWMGKLVSLPEVHNLLFEEDKTKERESVDAVEKRKY